MHTLYIHIQFMHTHTLYIHIQFMHTLYIHIQFMHTHTLYNAICICLCMLQCSLNEKGQPVLKILRKLDVAFDIVAFQVHITSCHYMSIMCMYHYKFKEVINFGISSMHEHTHTHTHTHSCINVLSYTIIT